MTDEILIKEEWEERFDEEVHEYTERELRLMTMEDRILAEQNNRKRLRLKLLISLELQKAITKARLEERQEMEESRAGGN